MFSAGLGAAGLGVVFPATRNGLEVDGARVLAHLATRIKMVSSFLTFVMFTLMSRVPRSSPTITPSREMTFPISHIPPLLPSERILDKFPAIHL